MSVAPRVAHRGARSSQATCAAVDNSSESLTHKNPDTPDRGHTRWRAPATVLKVVRALGLKLHLVPD